MPPPGYRKQEPTFSDAIAAVRRVLWCPPNFSTSRPIGEIIEIPTSLLNRSLPNSMPRSLKCGKSSFGATCFFGTISWEVLGRMRVGG